MLSTELSPVDFAGGPAHKEQAPAAATQGTIRTTNFARHAGRRARYKGDSVMGQYWNGSQWVNQAGAPEPDPPAGGPDASLEEQAEAGDVDAQAALAEARAETEADDDTEENPAKSDAE